ncbi:YkvA family protein [Bacillus xiapuensis]|uniref:YkvA family protein n=1 Tax=Bacillus xiapuensis TaxID=2014075 RepID=UPI000C249D7C|nr:DUF1232 domain-containing protein [Bacillus xiapuensis]
MKKIWKRVRFLLNIRRFLPFLKDFFISSEVSWGKKALSVGFIAGYFLLPFDLIPDFFAAIGIVDDLAVFVFIVQQMINMAPASLAAKHQLN